MWNADVSSSWLAGFTVCLSLIVSIGAQNLYVLRQAVHGQHVRACVALCVASDVALTGVGVAGMAQLLSARPGLARWLTLGAALFLLAYGLMALWRMAMAAGVRPVQPGQLAQRGALGVLSTLAAITLLNPHVYLDTVLLMGSIGARQPGMLKGVYVAGIACASLTWFMLLAFAGQRLKYLFGRPQAWRVLDGLTGVTMLVLSGWLATGAWQAHGA